MNYIPCWAFVLAYLLISAISNPCQAQRPNEHGDITISIGSGTFSRYYLSEELKRLENGNLSRKVTPPVRIGLGYTILHRLEVGVWGGIVKRNVSSVTQGGIEEYFNSKKVLVGVRTKILHRLRKRSKFQIYQSMGMIVRYWELEGFWPGLITLPSNLFKGWFFNYEISVGVQMMFTNHLGSYVEFTNSPTILNAGLCLRF